MLTETLTIDKIEIIDLKIIQIRKVLKIFRDEIEISSNFIRINYSQGDDISNEEQIIKDIASLIWK